MGYVYKFVDYYNNIIYIGKSNNLEKRMKQHFTNGHLPTECYEQVARIFFIFVDGKTDTDIMETFLINKYYPKFNTEKQFREILDLHNNDFIIKKEAIWKELFFTFNKNGIELSTIKIPPKYYNRNLSISERCISLLENNVYSMKYRKGLYEYYLKDIVNVDELLKYFLLLHEEIINTNNIVSNYSDLDEPINEYNSSEYVAFDIDKINLKKFSYLLILSQLKLIIRITDEYYGILVHNKYTLSKLKEYLFF